MRVMLAATPRSLDQIRFPILAQPKIDGVRAYVENGVVCSRTGKPIPSQWVQTAFGTTEYDLCDGELVAGIPTSPNVWSKTVSAVMTHDSSLPVDFIVFDRITSGTYTQRCPTPNIDTVTLHNLTELRTYEAELLDGGYEGVILRNPTAPYKRGRSTMSKQELVKVKTFHDDEATITGITTMDSDSRSPMMGSLLVEGKDGEKFGVGTGFTEEQRKEFLRHPPIGCIITYRYQSKSDGIPRFPSFKGIRPRGI